MRGRALWCVLILSWPGLALAQTADPVRLVMEDQAAIEIAQRHASDSLRMLIAAYEAAKKEAAAAAYWRDACLSTPECGGSK